MKVHELFVNISNHKNTLCSFMVRLQTLTKISGAFTLGQNYISSTEALLSVRRKTIGYLTDINKVWCSIPYSQQCLTLVHLFPSTTL